MFKLYYCSSIDINPKAAFEQIENFKKILSKYDVEVYGAGFKESPIISPDSSDELKGVVAAYDLRQIRQCDILLVVTDLKTFCPGTFIEFEYARNLGLYIIVFILPKIKRYIIKETKYKGYGSYSKKLVKQTLKNIFLETYANKIIYSIEELENILKDVGGEKND